MSRKISQEEAILTHRPIQFLYLQELFAGVMEDELRRYTVLDAWVPEFGV